MLSRPPLRTALLAVACSLLVIPTALGQSVEVEPADPTIEVGGSRQLEGFYVGQQAGGIAFWKKAPVSASASP